MKRSGPPARRTPLKAKAPLRSRSAGRAVASATSRERSPGEPQRTAAPDQGSGAPPRKQPKRRARARLPRTSKKRAALRDDERDAKMALYARDGGRCLMEGVAGWGACAGRWTPHHLRKQSKGWDWSLDNLVTLCVHMNGMVEDRPAEAHALGLVVRNGETKEAAWDRMRAAGLAR